MYFECIKHFFGCRILCIPNQGCRANDTCIRCVSRSNIFLFKPKRGPIVMMNTDSISPKSSGTHMVILKKHAIFWLDVLLRRTTFFRRYYCCTVLFCFMLISLHSLFGNYVGIIQWRFVYIDGNFSIFPYTNTQKRLRIVGSNQNKVFTKR